MKAQRAEYPQCREQRRYERHLICLQAIFKSNNIDDVSCEIQNFCEGGVLINYQGCVFGIDALDYLRNQSITIEFLAVCNGRNQRFGTTGKAVRITASEIALSFEESPSKTPFIEALFAAAENSKNKVETGSASGNDPGTRKQNLTEGCIGLVNRSLHQIFEHFFENLEDELCAAADQAKSDVLKNAYWGTILELKHDRENLEEIIGKSVTDKLTGTGKGKDTALQKLKEQDEGSELSLVDSQKFEDWLNISEVISRLNNLFERELQVLDGKVSFISKQSSGNGTNPLAPDYICELFWDEVDKYGFDYEIRKTLYKIFETSLKTNLSGLYDPLMSLMEGVHPKISSPGNIKANTVSTASGSNQSPTAPFILLF